MNENHSHRQLIWFSEESKEVCIESSWLDNWMTGGRPTYHEFQRDGITICTTFTPFKPENTRLLSRKDDIIIDIRVMYDHSKGKTLILSKNISLLVQLRVFKRRDGIT